mmetsp:Transcript_1121/g.1125  ORF Transcript_1121/g.1125 Transcript_1121/m.1125 type:complete len:187 (+) Transcript_1121:15-575(+)
MKIINREEREAHATYLATEGAKGLFYGSILSVGLFNFLKIRHPAKFKSFSTSIKTCILIMPTIGSCAFWADQGSVVFDRRMHSYGGGAKILEDFRNWKAMSTPEKVVTVVKGNKYKILIGTWLGSLYGIWAYVESNKIMSATQKATKIKKLSIASTGVLALGIGSLILGGRYPTRSKSQPSGANKE